MDCEASQLSLISETENESMFVQAFGLLGEDRLEVLQVFTLLFCDLPRHRDLHSDKLVTLTVVCVHSLTLHPQHSSTLRAA